MGRNVLRDVVLFIQINNTPVVTNCDVFISLNL
jgi:hypothetical protein